MCIMTALYNKVLLRRTGRLLDIAQLFHASDEFILVLHSEFRIFCVTLPKALLLLVREVWKSGGFSA